MPKASEIMKLAGVQLLDEDHIRWPLTELADWVNDGVKAIVLAKPSASSKSGPGLPMAWPSPFVINMLLRTRGSSPGYSPNDRPPWSATFGVKVSVWRPPPVAR